MFFCFVFDFFDCMKKAQRTLKKSVQTMDTKQAKFFIWADATEFFWILIPADAPIRESKVLPAVPVTSPPSASGGLRSRAGASINAKPKNFSSVKSVAQGPRWRQVVSDLLSPDQIEMKNRRRRSFHTEPTLICFFGFLFPSYVFQTISLSVPDSSHWTLCILRRAYNSLPSPICAHLCLCTQSEFRHFSEV